MHSTGWGWIGIISQAGPMDKFPMHIPWAADVMLSQPAPLDMILLNTVNENVLRYAEWETSTCL